MSKSILNFVLFVTLSLVLFQCANRGTADGGPKDETPPVIIKEEPENFSTNFTANEIRIYFDEYIKFKNIQKQLIVSPPMDPEPEITPLSAASKYITIKIYDTLQPNTTYAINFGESIIDNNEGNPFPFYKYVFSTGSYIDSLSVKGVLVEAFERETPESVSVLLHEVDSTYTDSIVFKQKPKYIGITDSLSEFSVDNIKAGTYLLTALKEENTNYIYQPKDDKFGYRSQFVTVPSDTAYVLKLFKQNPEFKFTRARQLAESRIGFAYEGAPESLGVKLLSDVPDDFLSTTSKEFEKDTLNFWMHPKLDVDSLRFHVAYFLTKDTVTVRMKKMDKDSLILKTVNSTLKPGDDMLLRSSIPLTSVDMSKTSIIDKDSIAIKSQLSIDENNPTLAKLNFDLTQNNTYDITLLPGALKDFYGTENDTLRLRAGTKLLSDYGNIRVSLRNAKYPIILQFVTTNGDVKEEKIARGPGPVDFINIDPGNYFLRAIFDTNNNGKYDSGNFLKKTQPERVSYAEESIEVLANWDSITKFILDD
jgi:uncharacterized protein (DUF2141 family)